LSRKLNFFLFDTILVLCLVFNRKKHKNKS
jgi:hypothetical protein